MKKTITIAAIITTIICTLLFFFAPNVLEVAAEFCGILIILALTIVPMFNLACETFDKK
jgi:hypothetical protein